VIETILASVGLAICIGMLIRLGLNSTRQRKLDRLLSIVAAVLLYFPRKMRAARGAAQAIRRAKQQGDWDGNVYTPKSFRRPRKPH
jgi:hypothetical protein